MKWKKSLSLALLFLCSFSHGKVISKPDQASSVVDVKNTPAAITTFHIITGSLPPLRCPIITAESIEPPEMDTQTALLFLEDLERRKMTVRRALSPIPTLSGNPLMGNAGIQGKILTPNAEGLLVFYLEDPIKRRIHMTIVSSGVGPKPMPLRVEDTPMWCDVILYFNPKQIAIYFEPFLTPPLTYPEFVNLPDADLVHAMRQLVFKIASDVTQKEREIFGSIVSLYNNTVNTFLETVKAYVPTITYQIAGRQGQISVDLQWFINDYSGRLHMMRKSMTDKDKEILQYLTYVILTGYRAKGVQYPEDPYEVAMKNLTYIASLRLFNVPLLPQVEKIKLWQMPLGNQLYPELNPVLTKFLSIPPPTPAPPRSVLDVPVLIHLIMTHDFAQDTLFTRFIVAYFQNSPFPEANPVEARKVFEKMKTALAPKQEHGHRESKDLQKQLDNFVNRMQEYKKRIFPNE